MWLLPSKKVETYICTSRKVSVECRNKYGSCSAWLILFHLFIVQTWPRTMGCICPKAFVTDKRKCMIGFISMQMTIWGWNKNLSVAINQLRSCEWETWKVQCGNCLGCFGKTLKLPAPEWTALMGRNQRGFNNLRLRNNKSGKKYL